MFKEPWFSILEESEPNRRSIADIAAEVANEHGLPLAALRGDRRDHAAVAARHEAFRRVRLERPDVSSCRAAIWFRCEGSTIRHVWLGRYQKRPRVYTKSWTQEERRNIATQLRCGATRQAIAAQFGISDDTCRKRIARDDELKRATA